MGFFDLFKKKKDKEQANKYRIGMEKTRGGALSRLKKLFSSYDEITDELFDELEEIFVMADIGVDTVVKFIDELRDDERVKGLQTAKELQPIIIDKMFDLYLKGEIVPCDRPRHGGGHTAGWFCRRLRPALEQFGLCDDPRTESPHFGTRLHGSDDGGRDRHPRRAARRCCGAAG